MSTPLLKLGAVKVDGRLKFDNEVRYRAFVSGLKDGARCTIAIRRESKRRTLQQNKWLWGGVYPAMLSESGYESHEVKRASVEFHYAMLKKCFGSKWNARLQEEIPNVIGSKKLTRVQFSEYTDWLVRRAAEEGIVIPEPDPAWRLKERQKNAA